jgi:colanic acid/amylovoran biosynthesis protein
MRILVEPSDYVLRNAGDMAMLHTAVTRLGTLWPEADIQVFSDAPDLLPAYCPNSRPLTSAGRAAWLSGGFLDGLPVVAERFLRGRAPRLVQRVLKWRGLLSGELGEFLEAVSQASLVVVTGMGGITDAFPEYAHGVLDTLELAQYHRVPTVMVGQGIGPIGDPHLLRRSRRVLSRLDFISLREGCSGLALLERLGVARERIMVTGDDAIELAYVARASEAGTGIGVNLRAASYSGIGVDAVARVREVLQTSARTLRAPLIPVPISRVPGEADAETIRILMEGAGESQEPRHPESWRDVFDQLRSCRIVVTGSYHAGVFALAQGIPAVGIAGSQYYDDKFRGLADQFGPGCAVVRLAGDGAFESALSDVIARFWQMADQLRPALLERAATQIDLSLAAYQRIRDLVESRYRRVPATVASL